jgi:anaerobic C4-dicarboxylate transporter
MPRRLTILLAATAVLAIFLAGLFIHGRLGGAFLAATAAILISLTSLTWPQLRPQGRPIRVVVIAAVAALAIVKLVRG